MNVERGSTKYGGTLYRILTLTSMFNVEESTPVLIRLYMVK